jgi:hypothetical protein
MRLTEFTNSSVCPKNPVHPAIHPVHPVSFLSMLLIRLALHSDELRREIRHL